MNRKFLLILIIFIIFFIMILNLFKKSDNVNEVQKLSIENAARGWGLKNINDSDIKYITLNKLISSGALNKKVINNVRDEKLKKAGVCVSYKENNYIYKFIYNVQKCNDL